MNKIIPITIVMLLLVVISGCGLKDFQKNNNVLSEETSSSKVFENTVEGNTYITWATTSETEYIIIDNNLYGRGKNKFGLFGNDLEQFYENWIKIAENAIHVEATESALLYLTDDGNLYGLGIADNDIFRSKMALINADNLITTPLLLDVDCKYFSLSNEYIITLKNDNTLWFRGESKQGQGTIIKDVVYEPIQIADDAQFIKTFGYTISWIDSTGNLYLCGDNSFNQIGNGKYGCGDPEQCIDIVLTPFCPLKNCKSFFVTDNMVIYAKTFDEKEYIWGNYHSATPKIKSEEMPERTKNTELSNNIILQDDNYTLHKDNYPIIFYADKDEKNNRSVIFKKNSSDNNEQKKVVKSNIVPPFTMGLLGNAITISNINDDCVYLVSYEEISIGLINNIQTSLLYDHYALPVYIMDSTHLVLASPQSYKELILDTESGETQEGDFWSYEKFDNKPNITPLEAENIALKELSKNKYSYFNEMNHDFSNVEFVSLVFEPNFQCLYLNSWITPEALIKKGSITWCYHIQIKDSKNSFDTMEIYIDANTGAIYSIVNTSN